MQYGDVEYVQNDIANHNGQVLRSYITSAGQNVYLWAEGPRVHKWTCTVGDGCGRADSYTVDRLVHACRVGSGVVDCNGMKNDPDMAPYITW